MIRNGRQDFLSNLILLLLLNLLIKPVYILGIDAEVQARVGTEIYGSYFALLNISFLLNILCDLGINNYTTREVAKAGIIQQNTFAGTAQLRLFLGLIYLIIALICGFILGYRGFEIEMLLILAINQVFASFILFFRSNLTGLHLFRKDSLISVLDRLLLIIGLGYLLLRSSDTPFDIRWLVYGQTAAYLITALSAYWMLKPYGAGLKYKLNFSEALLTLKASYPYALLIFMMMVYNRTDGVMLERMLDDGAAQAGIYARAYRFFEALNMVAYLFAVLLLPMFSKALHEKTSIRPLVKTGFQLLLFGSCIVACLGFFYSTEIMEFRYDDLTTLTAPVLQILLLGFVALSISYVTGTLLTASGDLRSLNRIALLSVLLNVVLNFLMIPVWGAYGSAVATLITQWFAVFAQVYSIAYRFRPKPDYSLLIRSSLFVSLLATSGYLSTIIDAGIGFKIGILLGSGIVFGILTRLLNISTLITMLKERLEA
jgi:O-antigen/teichoic acid export membrane protein